MSKKKQESVKKDKVACGHEPKDYHVKSQQIKKRKVDKYAGKVNPNLKKQMD